MLIFHLSFSKIIKLLISIFKTNRSGKYLLVLVNIAKNNEIGNNWSGNQNRKKMRKILTKSKIQIGFKSLSNFKMPVLSENLTF